MARKDRSLGDKKPSTTSARRALRAKVPPDQCCEICGFGLAPERHFPRGFTRVCAQDLAEIKETIRKRVSMIVAEVFAEAKARQLKELLKQ